MLYCHYVSVLVILGNSRTQTVTWSKSLETRIPNIELCQAWLSFVEALELYQALSSLIESGWAWSSLVEPGWALSSIMDNDLLLAKWQYRVIFFDNRNTSWEIGISVDNCSVDACWVLGHAFMSFNVLVLWPVKCWRQCNHYVSKTINVTWCILHFTTEQYPVWAS